MTNDQRFWAPEVLQTSAIDCGPAALKCLVEGFGRAVSYGRLREACQTDVDGTSIDTIQAVAVQLGLQAEQVMTPFDHLLLPSAQNLPALAVTVLPGGQLHFIILWRTVGRWVQVMDPATGRRWLSSQRLHHELLHHTLPLPATVWEAWARSDGFLAPLRARLLALVLTPSPVEALIEAAVAIPGWRGVAALDAATRLVQSVATAQGVERGAPATKLIEKFFQTSQPTTTSGQAVIPASFWTVQAVALAPVDEPVPPFSEGAAPAHQQAETLLMRGTVVMRVLGRQEIDPTTPMTTTGNPDTLDAQPQALSPDLLAALTHAPSHPDQTLWQIGRAEGLLTPTVLLVGVLLAATGITLEALLLRGLLAFVAHPSGTAQRNLLFTLCITLTALLWLLDLPILTITQGVGRRVEMWLRITLLEKIPRLADRYFRSRLIADMVHRAYNLRPLRTLPALGVRLCQLSAQLLLTATGIVWLSPASAPWVILSVILIVGFTWGSEPILSEFDRRLRTLSGALNRFYLDALLGVVPIRTHSAAPAIRREQEGMLVAWVRASQEFYRLGTLLQAGQALFSLLPAIAIVWHYVAQDGDLAYFLLLLYWALTLPALGQTLAETIQQYPTLRNRLAGALELVDAPDEDGEVRSGERGMRSEELGNKLTDQASLITQVAPLPHSPFRTPHSPFIVLDGVSVQAGGRPILHDISLAVRAGEHVAIVGASGAGKSSLVGLLLGWHRPVKGQVWVDGELLTAATLPALRRATAWVDPTVQLWNRSLLENLGYGLPPQEIAQVEPALAFADLYTLLQQLPKGLQTQLGEGGALVSGGEGQRVRLGRARLRSDVRLVILDEPLRGLDRSQRQHLLARARHHWRNATLLCITHDVSETEGFDRVLIMAEGRIVEDDAPTALLRNPASHYHRLLAAESAVRQQIWSHTAWRRLWLAEGNLAEQETCL